MVIDTDLTPLLNSMAKTQQHRQVASRNSIAFFSTMLTMALLVTALEGYVFGRYEQEVSKLEAKHSVSSRTIPTYFALFLFAEIFGLVVAWDSLRAKNTIQVIGLCAYHVALMIYAIIQIDQIKEALGPILINDSTIWGTSSAKSVEPWLILIPAIIGSACLLLIYLAYRLYKEFGWTIYKHIGADLAMRRHFMAFQIFLALLKFDFIFFVGFTIQFAVIILNISDPEFGLTIAVIPVTIGGLLFTSWALRHERVWGLIITLVYFLCAMAYFLFKLIRMYSGPKRALYGSARRPLATFAILTLALLIVSIVNALVCMRNFGKGLKAYVARRRPGSEPSSPEMLMSMDLWQFSKTQKPSTTHRLELD